MNSPGGRLVNSRQQVEDSRLAGAVWSDQSVDLTLLDGHVELVDGAQTAETNRCLIGLQDNGGTVSAHRGFSPPTEVSLCVGELAVPLGPSVSRLMSILTTLSTDRDSSKQSSALS